MKLHETRSTDDHGVVKALINGSHCDYDGCSFCSFDKMPYTLGASDSQVLACGEGRLPFLVAVTPDTVELRARC